MARSHETKFEAVEAHYAQHSAWIRELQQSIFAASAANNQAPTGIGSPGVAALRDRLDQLSRNALDTNDKRKETEDKLVTLDFAILSMQAHGFSESHRKLLQAMDLLRAEFGKRLADLEPRIAEGVCKCPASRPGRRAGPCGQAPRAGSNATGTSNAAAGAQKDIQAGDSAGISLAAEPPRADRGQDPWSQAWAEGRGGSGGPGGHGGDGNTGGGGPGGPGRSGSGGGGGSGGPGGGNDRDAEFFDFSGFSQDRHGASCKPLTKFCKSPFETKAATQELPRFNGNTGREIWSQNVTFYLHSRNPDMMGLLRSAGQQQELVTA